MFSALVVATRALLQTLDSAVMKADIDDAQGWLCANKTLFAKTGGWFVLAQSLLF